MAQHSVNRDQPPVNAVMVLPAADAFRNYHRDLPLVGDPLKNPLTLTDDLLLYLVAAVRNIPREPPVITTADWDHFIHTLRPHGILPFIRSHIRSWPVSCQPPPEITSLLDAMFLRSAARNLLIGRQLESVLAAMQGAGIPVVLLKGQALGYTIYGDPAVRLSLDIDLLVKPGDVDGCDAVLRGLGYSCPVRHFTRSQSEVHHDSYSPSGPGVKIELHWTPSFTFPMFPGDWLDKAFERKISIREGGFSWFTLDPVDHLIYLIFHNIVQHFSLRIDWICDMAFLMDSLRVPQDWERLREQCIALHLLIPLQHALTAADLWCGVEMPAGSYGVTPLPPPSEQDTRIWENVTNRRQNLRSSLSLKMRGIPGIQKKLQFLWHFIFPPAERLQRYRKSSSQVDIPLAHLRRWCSILRFL